MRSRAECPRPDEATSDTSCRCYLRGPDGVRRLTPSGTWDTRKITAPQPPVKRRGQLAARSRIARSTRARARHGRSVDVEVGDGADARRAPGRDAHSLLAPRAATTRRAGHPVRQIDHHDVRVGRHDARARRRRPRASAKRARVRVIVGQPRRDARRARAAPRRRGCPLWRIPPPRRLRIMCARLHRPARRRRGSRRPDSRAPWRS